MKKIEFEAIGTSWTIEIQNNLAADAEVVLLKKIKNRIDLFDKAYSRFRDDSLIMKMAVTAGDHELPEDAGLMIEAYRKIYDATEELVTPLIGQVLVDAGYDAEYSLTEKEMKQAEKWDNVMIWNDPMLTLKKPALLDFGAGGKGYLVDIISELLEEESITSYYVDAGGDIRQRNPADEVMRVGLENPRNFEEVIGVANLLNKSLCGSAGNRRRWGRFHHVIHPDKLSSPEHIEAIWVVADSTLLADLLTTALFFVEPGALKDFDFEYLIIHSDSSIEKSENFPAEIFIS